jgi:mannose-6-phosphate isomerase-like protein (cupin superfamily)
MGRLSAVFTCDGIGVTMVDRRPREACVMFETKRLPADRDAIAPDGSEVRLLLGLSRGGLAHFQLAPGETSVAVCHRSREELWYFVSGAGVMWRREGEREEEVEVGAGVAISIPVGTHFQFRSTGASEPLAAIGVTMPPWPGDGEAIRSDGKWDATVAAGPGLAEG